MSADSLPKQTPEWLRKLLCHVEVELEQEALRGASLVCDTDEDYENYANDRRGDAHKQLRKVLYG